MLTIDEIKNISFRKATLSGGYRAEDVDAFIEDVIASFEQLKKEKQRLKILQNQRKVLERKARTHRLCQHGALLERYFPPDEFTDEMIRFLMDGTFNRQDEAVRDLMEEVKDIFQSEEKDKAVAD